MKAKCGCCDSPLFGMQQQNIKNTIVGIINGDVTNGFKKNELFDANAVMD